MNNSMLQNIIALVAGLVFGFGLIIGGMVNPAKVQGFLDILQWDLSLAFVMIGALIVASISFALSKSWRKSLLGSEMRLPTAKQIDKRLVIGALLFGAGWGIAGVCPAPAVLLATTGAWQGIVFMAAMLIGMMGFGLFNRAVTKSN